MEDLNLVRLNERMYIWIWGLERSGLPVLGSWLTWEDLDLLSVVCFFLAFGCLEWRFGISYGGLDEQLSLGVAFAS